MNQFNKDKRKSTERCPMHESVEPKCPVHKFIKQEIGCFYARLAAKFGHNFYGEAPDNPQDIEQLQEVLKKFEESDRPIGILKMPGCPIESDKAEEYIKSMIAKSYEAFRLLQDPKADIENLREYVSENLRFTLKDNVAVNFDLAQKPDEYRTYFILPMGGFYSSSHQRFTDVTPFLIFSKWDYFMEIEDAYEVLYDRTVNQFSDKEKGDKKIITVLSVDREKNS